MTNLLKTKENLSIGLTDAQNVLYTLQNGQKVAIFAVGNDGQPAEKLSDVFFRVSTNYDKSDELLEPALRYLHANYNKDIKLNYLANLCDVSAGYFSRIFSKRVGVGLNAYVVDLRLNQACKLLKATSRSVVSIACEVGYVDCGYFYKLFKRKYGCTPLEYRRIQIST